MLLLQSLLQSHLNQLILWLKSMHLSDLLLYLLKIEDCNIHFLL